MSDKLNNFVTRFKNTIVTNIKTIIQAFIFSVAIWLFISIQIFPDVSLTIPEIPVTYSPTTFMNDEDLHITDIDTSSVTIQIQGKRYALSELTADNFTAECDLSGIYEAGVRTVPINVSSKSDVEYSITSRDLSAEITVVKMISRDIEVIPNTEDLTIASGMQIEGDVTVTPPVVTIRGEETLVNSIGHAEAVAYSDEELDRSEPVHANIVFYNNSGAKMSSPDITASAVDFTVSVPVYKLRTLPVQVKFTGSGIQSFDPDNLNYTMSIDELTIASPDSSIDNLDAIDIGEISLAALTLKDLQGGVSLPVELPEGYKNISGNRTVTVTFPDAENFGQLGFTVPSDNFSVINVPSSYDVKLLTNELTVNVVGYSNYIQEMTSSDIYATINLLGMELSEGSKSLSVTFRLKGSNVQAWVTGEEYRVELLITEAAEDEEPEETEE